MPWRHRCLFGRSPLIGTHYPVAWSLLDYEPQHWEELVKKSRELKKAAAETASAETAPAGPSAVAEAAATEETVTATSTTAEPEAAPAEPAAA